MRSKDDLLRILNEIKPLIYGDDVTLFQLKQLMWCANPKLGGKRYTEFMVKKKSGTERKIHAPVKDLKAVQKTLSVLLQCVFEPHKAAMGFVQGKSIVDNAKIHVGSRYIYNIDLKDFFPSVDQARVWKCLQLKPFNLNNSSSIHVDSENKLVEQDDSFPFEIRNGWITEKKNNRTKSDEKNSRSQIANIIASICCTELEVERQNENGEWIKVKRNVLPQGAPTSPIITNIICQKLDFLLTGVAKRFGLRYSRYADDITFSSLHNVYQSDSDFIKELNRIISEQKFHIKESKTRLQKDGFRQEVTGLLVNETVNVPKRYIKQLRMWLYYWERYGHERATGYFSQQYIADKGHVKNGQPDITKVILGKLNYLKMVKGADNELYLKLKNRLDLLIGLEDPINNVLNVWESDGIEKAMDFYYRDKLN